MKKYLYLAFVISISYVHGAGQDHLNKALHLCEKTPGWEPIGAHILSQRAVADKKKSEQEFKLRQAINVLCKKEEGILKEFIRLWRIVSTAKTAEEREAKMDELSRYIREGTIISKINYSEKLV